MKDNKNNYDYCYECRELGDNYIVNEYGEDEWCCPQCPLFDEYEWDD